MCVCVYVHICCLNVPALYQLLSDISLQRNWMGMDVETRRQRQRRNDWGTDCEMPHIETFRIKRAPRQTIIVHCVRFIFPRYITPADNSACMFARIRCVSSYCAIAAIQSAISSTVMIVAFFARQWLLSIVCMGEIGRGRGWTKEKREKI